GRPEDPGLMKPFHFIAEARDIVDGRELAVRARRAEQIGYHALVVPDHLIEQLSPIPTLATIAAATERLRIAAFVFNNDLRHPAVLAQDLASLDVLSGGRLDVAIGAGWNKPEYEAIGLPFDPVPVRQARLEEAIAVLKGAFGDSPFSFAGDYYTITDLDGQPKPVQKPHPPFLIGGGGRRTLELAGREAQIVGLAPRILSGQRSDPASLTIAATAEKIQWVRAAAGDHFETLEFNVYPSTTEVSITDHALAEGRELAARLADRSSVEVTAEELLESPHIFIGSLASLEDKFRRHRDQLGISSIMVGELGPFDSLVERLAGT
ncbi:MAG: TIGR03621 family F420-dependent LLM class oxidoreductase, partial [Chloroflexota bacterium]